MARHERTEDTYLESFPQDFGERLERLVELAGMPWEEFAERVGVELERVAAWREGEVPTGAEVWHIMRLAFYVPGGIDVMLPEKDGVDEEEKGSAWLAPDYGGEYGSDGRRERSRSARPDVYQRSACCPRLPDWAGDRNLAHTHGETPYTSASPAATTRCSGCVRLAGASCGGASDAAGSIWSAKDWAASTQCPGGFPRRG